MVTEERPEQQEENIVTEERPEQQEENIGWAPTGSQEIAPVEIKDLVAPKGVSDLEVETLKSRAADLVNDLENATGSKELELSDNIGHVGAQAQRRAGTELELLRTRVGRHAYSRGPQRRNI